MGKKVEEWYSKKNQNTNSNFQINSKIQIPTTFFHLLGIVDFLEFDF